MLILILMLLLCLLAPKTCLAWSRARLFPPFLALPFFSAFSSSSSSSLQPPPAQTNHQPQRRSSNRPPSLSQPNSTAPAADHLASPSHPLNGSLQSERRKEKPPARATSRHFFRSDCAFRRKFSTRTRERRTHLRSIGSRAIYLTTTTNQP